MIPDRSKSRLDRIANILTVIVAILFIVVFVKQYIFPTELAQKGPVVGNEVVLNDFDPSTSNKSVLLVLLKGCRFCEESMGFYRGLLEQNRRDGLRFVAVFPPGTEDAESYLRTHGLADLDVKYSELSAIAVDGTPTIIVIDHTGTVTRSWVGRLSANKEIEVRSFLES